MLVSHMNISNKVWYALIIIDVLEMERIYVMPEWWKLYLNPWDSHRTNSKVKEYRLKAEPAEKFKPDATEKHIP